MKIEQINNNPVLNLELIERRKKILTSKRFKKWYQHIKTELKKTTYEREIC